MAVRVGVTLGDPAGVGPEIVRAALQSGSLPADADYLVIGEYPEVAPGQSTRDGTLAAIAALEKAAVMANAREIDAVVTGPIHKAQCYAAGFEFPGQTEFFAARAGVADFAMLLTGGSLTVALVTAHLPLHQVATKLSSDEIARVGRLLLQFLRRRGVPQPRIAVAGLNPHAGEAGELGDEEKRLIEPAIASLNQTTEEDIPIFSGPHSPDTIFHQAVQGNWDGVLCMYHDQGLIPLKLHAFHEGVNVTLGLPFPRTSPDHGTAFELAGTGRARPDSMIAAMRLAAELASSR